MKRMNLKEKRKMAIHLIEGMDEAKLDAFLTLMKSPYDGLVVSEDDWAEVEYRSRMDWEGKAKMTDAREAGKRVLASLKKKRKKK